MTVPAGVRVAANLSMLERPPTDWKLIVAADEPWSGVIYHSRPGHDRQRFDTIETFCCALLAATGWSLNSDTRESSGSGSIRHQVTERSHASRRRRLAFGQQSDSTKRKFIISAATPWNGEVYRTRPGLTHLYFATFEQFLRAVQEITGWSVA